MPLKLLASKKRIILIGFSLIIISQIILGLTFYPIIAVEISYNLQNIVSKNQNNIFEFSAVNQPNQEFQIIIPKINIKSKVLINIDPFNKTEYLAALKKGVAQAQGTALPNQEGNIFLFAHSANNSFDLNTYNAIFYLVNKLTAGDLIYLIYQGKNYKYIVDTTKIINPNEIQYLYTSTPKQTLTLMTCWPPGTTFKRLLVNGHLVTE